MEADAVRTPRRSAASRAAILEAARALFASVGYERATIRAIARDAAIDPSMVMRYYGSKENLFAAASQVDLRLPPREQFPPGGEGARLVGHFLDRWEADGTLAAMLRVGVTKPAGAERLQEALAQQVGPLVAGLCPHPEQAPARTALIVSQILGMALCRFMLRLPPAVLMSRDDVINWLGPTVQRYLTADMPQRS